jgi:hypothetical protein
MSKPTEIEKLADQFIALWQQQLAAVAADDTLAETTMRMAHMFTAGAAAAGAAAETPEKDGGLDRNDEAAGSTGDDRRPTGAKTGGDAPVDDSGELEQLSRRVAELEERLARLEGRA